VKKKYAHVLSLFQPLIITMQKNCIIFLNIYAGVPWLLLLLTPTEQNHSRRKKKTVAEFMHHELVVTGIYSQNCSVLVGLMQ
jgi:hypothetical protein